MLIAARLLTNLASAFLNIFAFKILSCEVITYFVCKALSNRQYDYVKCMYMHFIFYLQIIRYSIIRNFREMHILYIYRCIFYEYIFIY